MSSVRREISNTLGTRRSTIPTANISSRLDNAVWPGNGETRDLHKGQVAHPSSTLPFDFSMC
ncbi:hypothetical protein [Streptomyces sp. MUM 178J]|uniref:hypothetical protein n=1 Tax=Streptomyces sp. MUM 178J TaxID=2791991 RepID=UPI001F03B090|nr:hypothetical protein [Streptomyces sp. MUM 178J]WRQ81954.1 hypothetical protein I3F59_022740 [Streptomyces sp. MUM 178J]